MGQHCSCTGMGSLTPSARQVGGWSVGHSAPLSPPITWLTPEAVLGDTTVLLLPPQPPLSGSRDLGAA